MLACRDEQSCTWHGRAVTAFRTQNAPSFEDDVDLVFRMRALGVDRTDWQVIGAIDPQTIEAVSGMIHAKFDEMMAEGAAELADLASRTTQLEGEQQKLLQAHYGGAIPLDLLKREQDRITASLETIEHRMTPHHGHYAAARENFDDSLKLLSNAADIYEHADDANRRLINQVLFKALYIDEDNDVRVGYRNPYDGLSIPGLHADALSWTAEAKKMGQVGTATKGGPLVASSHLTRLG